MTGWDIIGDIHGHADELVELLQKLGYSEQHGVFRHLERRVIFCGDFIDRGPQIPDVVRIARSMVESDAALAVMGNHEFNALAYHTPVPGSTSEYLRPHSERNRRQHAETLRQFEPHELESALKWFGTLPPALDLEGLRVVHACWDPVGIEIINEALKNNGAGSTDFLVAATTRGNEVFDAVERVMKGPELALPNDLTVTDKEGNIRRRIRIRWFDDPEKHCWNTYSLPVKADLPGAAVPTDSPSAVYPDDAPPVFVGHYWLPDAIPMPLRHNVACLDYSVAKDGLLTAYRFQGETSLKPEHFVTVASRNRKSQS